MLVYNCKIAYKENMSNGAHRRQTKMKSYETREWSTKKLNKSGLGVVEATKLIIKTEAQFIADWRAIFGRDPSATTIANARADGKIA